MTNFRLFPAENGPAAATSYTGNFIAGVVFAGHGGGGWLTGYWMWVCGSGGQPTGPAKCALWSGVMSPPGTGQLVPGSVVTSGTLIPGQWNLIPLSVPLLLAPGHDPTLSGNGSVYVAAIAVNGNFPDTTGYWATTGPGNGGRWGNGVTGSPLFAYSGNDGGATAFPPMGLSQGVFSTATGDPSASMPATASGTDNFWVDVQVSNTPPAGYAGSYRLWPNKADANPGSGTDDAVAYNIATEIDISQTVTLNAIHYYVPPSINATAGLATSASVWNIATQSKVAGIPAPAWTTESGGATPALGSNLGFWAKAQFAGGVTLPAGKYRVAVYNSRGASGVWGPKDAATNYYSVGAGSMGITQGPLTAPRYADAQLGDYYPSTGSGQTTAQPVFAYDGLESFPHFTTGTNPAQNYWIDLEATPVQAAATTSLVTGRIVTRNAPPPGASQVWRYPPRPQEPWAPAGS